MNPVNPSEGTALSEHSAADLLAGMIDETGGIIQPENDDDDQAEHQDEQEESHGDGADGDHAVEPGTDNATADDAADKTVKINVNGVDVEVPLADVIASYQKTAAPTPPATGTSQGTDTANQAISQERQQLAEQLTNASALLTAQIKQFEGLDWGALLEQDPQGYLRARHEYDSAQASMQAVNAQRGQLEQAIASDRHQAMQQLFQRETELLAKAFPQWSDAKTAQAEKQLIRDYMAKAGYQADEIERASDHRAIVIANKARLYDEMMSKGAAAVQKVKATPLRVEKPGGNAEPPNKRTEELRSRAARSGRAEDAAAVLLAGGLIR